jgi:hypothetical protein
MLFDGAGGTGGGKFHLGRLGEQWIGQSPQKSEREHWAK